MGVPRFRTEPSLVNRIGFYDESRAASIDIRAESGVCLLETGRCGRQCCVATGAAATLAAGAAATKAALAGDDDPYADYETTESGLKHKKELEVNLQLGKM